MAYNFVPEFFILENREFIKLPGYITGLHGLAKYLLNRYLDEQGYGIEDHDKAIFIMNTVDSSQNEGYSYTDALPLIASAIYSEYNIKKKKGVLCTSNRDRKHIEYTIRKELESVLKNYQALQKTISNETENTD